MAERKKKDSLCISLNWNTFLKWDRHRHYLSWAVDSKFNKANPLAKNWQDASL